MSLKNTYLIICVCLWVISSTLLNGKQKIVDCSVANSLKQSLIALDSKNAMDQSEKILMTLNELSSIPVIESCWEKETSPLVGRTIAILLKTNVQKSATITEIGRYIKSLNKAFAIIIEVKKQNGAKKKALDMFNELAKLLQEKNMATDLLHLSPDSIKKAFTYLDVLKQMEKIEENLQKYVQKREEKESPHPAGAPSAEQKKKENALMGRIINNIEGKYVALHVLEDYVFIDVIAAFFLALIIVFLLIFVYITRMKKTLTELLKIDDSIDGDIQMEERGETMPDSKKNDDLKKIRRLGWSISNLQKEVKALREKVDAYLPNNDSIQEINHQLKTISAKIIEMESVPPVIPKGVTESLNMMQSILKLPEASVLNQEENKIKSLENQINTLPDQITLKIVANERDILKRIWKEIWTVKFSENEKKELMGLTVSVLEREPLFNAFYNLESELSFDPDFSSFYSDVLKPLRNYKYKLNEIRGTLEVIQKKEISSTPVQDIFEIKQKIDFLVFMQYRNEVPEILNFKIEKWFQQKFLNFADQFLRKYQKEVFSGNLSKAMEKANTLVLDILGRFNIEPITIDLGKTHFDSKLHIGQSKIYETSMSDSVIAEVIKNGFRKIGGDVFIQPEVIVNRL